MQEPPEAREAFGNSHSSATARLFLDAASTNAARIVASSSASIVEDPAQADLLWVRQDIPDWIDFVSPRQAINHIPEERAMIRKAELARHLERYAPRATAEPLSLDDFYQPTWCLTDPGVAEAFVATLPEHDTPENLWILKPNSLSMGRGVRPVWKFDWLRKALRTDAEIRFRYEGREHEYILQRYIRDVLLLNGRKSEIRIYWLIASLDPLLVFMYPEGTARLTLEPFRLDDFTNPLIHITNAYQQKKHGNTEGAELKWDFARLERFLETEKGVGPDYLSQHLRPRLRQCLAYAVRACLNTLRHTPSAGHFFGVYGADFIIDEQLNPWLTEIQKGPGLSLDDEIKQRVLPPMLLGAISIVLEILELKRSGRSPAELSSTCGYEWVIGG